MGDGHPDLHPRPSSRRLSLYGRRRFLSPLGTYFYLPWAAPSRCSAAAGGLETEGSSPPPADNICIPLHTTYLLHREKRGRAWLHRSPRLRLRPPFRAPEALSTTTYEYTARPWRGRSDLSGLCKPSWMAAWVRWRSDMYWMQTSGERALPTACLQLSSNGCPEKGKHHRVLERVPQPFVVWHGGTRRVARPKRALLNRTAVEKTGLVQRCWDFIPVSTSSIYHYSVPPISRFPY